MSTIGVAAHKVGVGKTTVAVNLAASLVHLQEVLLFSNIPIMGIVPTLVSKQCRHAREAFDLMEENYSDLILQSIPRRVSLQDAMVAGKPIISYLPSRDVSHAFLTLAKEVLSRAKPVAA